MGNKKAEYEELKALWYSKLKEEGFADIEQDEENLKIWSVRFFIRHKKDPVLWQSKQHYYYMAEQFLSSYHFQSNIEKVIWEYHANALSARDISKLLKGIGIKMSKSTVWNVIKSLESTMRTFLIEEDGNEQ